MRLFLCWICPPLAVALCGKPFSAIFNVFLCLLFWFPGVTHARDIVWNHLADKRQKRELRAINHPAWTKELASPAIRNRMKQLREDKPQIAPMDPAIGQNGTRFRKRA